MSDLKEIMASPEYREALKQRIVSGTAKPAEINLAREMGIFSTEEDKDNVARFYARQMDPEASSLLSEMIIASMSAAAPTFRVIQAPGLIGVVMASNVRPQMGNIRRDPANYVPMVPNNSEPTVGPEKEPTETDDLMPAVPKKG